MLFYFPTTRNRCNPSSRCFYLDSQENAVKAGLSVKPSKHEKEITKKWFLDPILEFSYFWFFPASRNCQSWSLITAARSLGLMNQSWPTLSSINAMRAVVWSWSSVLPSLYCPLEAMIPSLNWLNCRPRRRHLVISEYIQASLDEATLLDEDGMSFLNLQWSW